MGDPRHVSCYKSVYASWDGHVSVTIVETNMLVLTGWVLWWEFDLGYEALLLDWNVRDADEWMEGEKQA